jgi:Cdc6-like AAA superfamily ATPase
MSLEEIANWASVLTGEDRRFGENGNHYYYVSDPVKRLIWKITHLNRQLIALIGLQGTGKTSALKYAFSKLLQVPTEEDRNPVIFIKLTKNLQESLEKACAGAIYKSINEEKRDLRIIHPFATLSKNKRVDILGDS